jgi:hypothetical protein
MVKKHHENLEYLLQDQKDMVDEKNRLKLSRDTVPLGGSATCNILQIVSLIRLCDVLHKSIPLIVPHQG